MWVCVLVCVCVCVGVCACVWLCLVLCVFVEMFSDRQRYGTNLHRLDFYMCSVCVSEEDVHGCVCGCVCVTTYLRLCECVICVGVCDKNTLIRVFPFLFA